ncbi:MAG: hypothetical protein LBI56_00535 [Puniceicoccales bacterium]|jgi:hypothetical protein|nr:hypothetical protein [Puniceicoccales bacterium]
MSNLKLEYEDDSGIFFQKIPLPYEDFPHLGSVKFYTFGEACRVKNSLAVTHLALKESVKLYGEYLPSNLEAEREEILDKTFNLAEDITSVLLSCVQLEVIYLSQDCQVNLCDKGCLCIKRSIEFLQNLKNVVNLKK